MEKISILNDENLSSSKIKFIINDHFANVERNTTSETIINIEAQAISALEYQNSFEEVLKNIEHGNSYLLNLTFPTPVKLSHDLNDVFKYSKAKYKLLWEDKFVVFSPETFIRIENNKVFSYPMKGTIDASIDNAKDILLNDKKELAEHYTIVDLIRNDLSSISDCVEVSKFRYFDKIKGNNREIYQTSSEIKGQLEHNWKNNLGTMLFKLLPAGSISGAPKQKTLEIIRKVEKDKRAYYTGVFGYFDGEELDSGVMIRFIEKKGNKLFYRSGGGITYQSKWEDEFEELNKKIYVPLS